MTYFIDIVVGGSSPLGIAVFMKHSKIADYLKTISSQ